SVSPTRTDPEVGVRIAAITESSVVLPQPLAPSNSTNSPAPQSRSSPSIGRTGYPPDEYSMTRSRIERSAPKKTHPPNASAGSTQPARRKPNNDAINPITTATITSCTYAEPGVSTAIGITGPMAFDRITATTPDNNARMIAWSAMPDAMVRPVTPVALNTA